MMHIIVSGEIRFEAQPPHFFLPFTNLFYFVGLKFGKLKFFQRNFKKIVSVAY